MRRFIAPFSHRIVLRVEPVGSVTRRRRIVFSLLVSTLAFILLAVPVLATGGWSVFAEYSRVWSGSFARRSLFEVARYSAAMMFTGLGALLAFRSRVWNIGLEGYMIVGAILTAYAGFSGMPWAAPLLAFLGGLVWSLPVALAMLLGLSEVVSSMMMYYVSLYLLQFVVYKVWPSPYGGFPQTPRIGVEQPVFLGLPMTFYAGLILAILLDLFYRRTVPGLVMRLVGERDSAALISGYNPRLVRLAVLLVSSGVAGLAGYHVASILGYLSMGYAQLGYGFAGITVAFLAALKPLAVIPSALLLGLVYHFASFASDILPGGYGAYFYYAQGVILISVLAARSLPRHRIIVRLVRHG